MLGLRVQFEKTLCRIEIGVVTTHRAVATCIFHHSPTMAGNNYVLYNGVLLSLISSYHYILYVGQTVWIVIVWIGVGVGLCI